jgi:hypothetical protein
MKSSMHEVFIYIYIYIYMLIYMQCVKEESMSQPKVSP